MENELALVYLALGQLGRAREYVAASRASFEKLQDARLLAHAVETEAEIDLAAGSPEEALAHAEEAIELARATNNRKAELSALVSLARARRMKGDRDSELETLSLAATLARQHGRRGQLQKILGELARAYASRGDLQQAFDLSQEALDAGRARSLPDEGGPGARRRGRSSSTVGNRLSPRQQDDQRTASA